MFIGLEPVFINKTTQKLTFNAGNARRRSAPRPHAGATYFNLGRDGVVEAANRAGADTLPSEDMGYGICHGATTVMNPFV